MTFSNDTLHEQQYDAWQSELLAEMGITRWVAQNSPVKVFENLDNLDAFYEHLALDNDTLTPQLLENSQPNSTSQTHIVDSTSIINPVEVHEPIDIESAYSSSNLVNSIQDNPNHSQEDLNDQLDKVLTASFDLQAIVVGEWTLVVDSHFLQKDERQQQIWQQITNGLKSTLHFFKFPLLGDNHQLPKSTVQLMSSYSMAVAGFSGFLYSIRLDSSQANAKVGALTQLPECLDEQPIQRLPYLNDMLEDYRLKRQLWQLLSSTN